MRNKGFFWFFTILLAIVSIYQLSFSFIGGGIEAEAEELAIEKVEELEASANGQDVTLPNGTTVNFTTNVEAKDLAKSAFINEILRERSNDEVLLGNTFKEVKQKSISLGLDLKGGMSVTLELSMPDLVKNTALNARDINFIEPYEKAMENYSAKGGDFIQLFAAAHKELTPNRPLIREFSTEEVISELGTNPSDEQVVHYLNKVAEGAMDGVETIMANRINQFGVAQPNITQDLERNRIYIELPGVKDQATMKEKIKSTANLEFYLAIKGNEIGGFFNDLILEKEDEGSLEDLFDEENKDTLGSANATAETAKDTSDLDLGEELLAEDDEADKPSAKLSKFGKMFRVNIDADNQFSQGPQLGFARAADTMEINKILSAHAEELMLENVAFMWSAKELQFKDNDTLYYTLFALQVPEDGKARVSGKDIDNARISVNPNDGTIEVNVEMNSRGAEEWGNMTSENVGNFIAIAMDDKVFSAPVIRSAITGGQTSISGGFTNEEANDLANLLNAGSLPAPIVIIEEAVVGPTIGAENSESGLISFGIALALVLVYMIFYYGKAGVVADLALVLNIIFIVGFLAAFGAVLTLAGIAGIVLTIGMSVDANVLIYERVREEISEGKGMRLAVKDGYKKALSSIVDANVTTLLTAIVLKVFGTGPIESFATTLIIGIFTSVFAAVVITRLIFEYKIERKGELSFGSKITKDWFKNKTYQFVTNRKKFYILSALLVIVSLAGLFTKGLKPSVEFKGGRMYETVFTNPVADKAEDIENVLRASLVSESGQSASVEVKKRNSDYRLEITTDYMLNVPNSETEVREAVLAAFEGVEEQYGTATIENSRSVSASISNELKQSSLVSIILSLIIIFVYILIRFGKPQYGIGALVAMAHDVIIVLGAFALLHGVLPFNMEIDQAFIAAILTVVGYSINDTVVVFDRIREYLVKYRTRDRKTVINDALNSTLSRTFNTSFSTFLVLLVIFIFDGGAIKGFVFALLIGVIVGTYSSLCIATPAVVDLTKEEEKD